MVIRIAQTQLQTLFGTFTETLYYNGKYQIIALHMGNITGYDKPVLCRVHSSCMSAHIFNSTQCDCREQFAVAQQEIQKEGMGVIIWLEQEGKGNGHFALMESSTLKDDGLFQTDAYEAIGFKKDDRDYISAAEALVDLGVHKIVLLTNNPQKIDDLNRNGIEVVGRRPLIIEPDPTNAKLKHALLGKIRAGHMIPLDNKE